MLVEFRNIVVPSGRLKIPSMSRAAKRCFSVVASHLAAPLLDVGWESMVCPVTPFPLFTAGAIKIAADPKRLPSRATRLQIPFVHE